MTESEKRMHIQNFTRSLLSVSPEYFGVPAIENRIQFIERAFAYELYHQLRQIYTGQNWYVNGELRKGLTFLPEYGQDNTLVPDLVIHKHETTTEDVIAVEIKTNPNVGSTEIIEDLKKLEIYTRPGDGFLNYHIGIMLIVNSNFRDLFSKMQERNKNQIRHLLRFRRIAIWNIHVPSLSIETGDRILLSDDCLEIVRLENLE